MTGTITRALAAATAAVLLAFVPAAPAAAAPGTVGAPRYTLDVQMQDGADPETAPGTESAEVPSLFGVFFLFGFLFVGLGVIGFALTRASGNRDAPVMRSTVVSPPHHPMPAARKPGT